MVQKYKTPAEFSTEHLDELRKRAADRRKALNKAGCQTYELGLRQGYSAIVCLCCGLGSNHPEDIRRRYCGFCYRFHETEDPT